MQHVGGVLASSDQTRHLTSRDTQPVSVRVTDGWATVSDVFVDGAPLEALADGTSPSVVFAV